MGCASSKAASAVSLTREAGAAEPRCFAGAHDGDEVVNAVAAGCAAGEWLTCAEDRVVALTDWRTGRVVRRWRGHEKGVNRVLAAPRTGGAVSASRDTTVRLWSAADEPLAVLRGHELSVSAIALSEDGRSLFSGSRDSSVRLWDLESATCTASADVSRNVVTCMAWLPGEAHLVAQGSEDLKLRLWDARATSRPAHVAEGYVYFPLCCAAARGHLLTGSNGFDGVGCELRLWDVRAGATPLLELGGHQQAVAGVALMPEPGGGAPRLAASASRDGELRVWDLAAQACTARLTVPGGGVTCLAAGGDAPPAEGDAAAPPAAARHLLYASCTTGRVHAYALSADGAELTLLATGGGEGALEHV